MNARVARSAGRTGVGLAIAATTVAAMTVPAGAASAQSAPTVGATALALPATPQHTTPAASHRVGAGDTVSAIAARAGTSVSAIVAANGLDSRARIKVGQVLRLPSAAPAAAPERTASRTHTVAAGDTVTALAKRYGTSVREIVAENRLNSRALIIIGQQLTIPGAPDTGVSSSGGTEPGTGGEPARTHEVRAGDTVTHLAQRYGTSVSRIVSANGLRDSGLIHVGQQLTIPGGAGSTSDDAPATVPVSNEPTTSTRTHVVRPGENLTALAQRYGTSVSAIVSRNDLRSANVVYVGQNLTIPGAETPSEGSEQLIGDTFLGRTYPSDVVSAANENKATLLSMDMPSRGQMRATVRQTAVRMGVDPALAMAVAQQESGFNPRAVSPANAVGVMQVIPSSGEWASGLVGRDLNLLDPQDNVVAGVAILRQLVRTADDFDQAIAGYYQGLAGVQRDGMYEDTRSYVSGIRNLMRQF